MAVKLHQAIPEGVVPGNAGRVIFHSRGHIDASRDVNGASLERKLAAFKVIGEIYGTLDCLTTYPLKGRLNITAIKERYLLNGELTAYAPDGLKCCERLLQEVDIALVELTRKFHDVIEQVTFVVTVDCDYTSIALD